MVNIRQWRMRDLYALFRFTTINLRVPETTPSCKNSNISWPSKTVSCSRLKVINISAPQRKIWFQLHRYKSDRNTAHKKVEWTNRRRSFCSPVFILTYYLFLSFFLGFIFYTHTYFFFRLFIWVPAIIWAKYLF